MFERPHHGGNLGWAAEMAGCPAFSLLDFSASINPLGPPAAVLAAIESALPALHHYPDPQYVRLRRAIADYHHLPVDWILPGNGSAELLTLAGRTFASLDCTYVVGPAFGDYGRSWRGAGAKLQTIPWEVKQAWPWQKLRSPSEITDNIAPQPQKRGLILNNPHNPSGTLLPREEILALLPHYQWVLLDEAFMDFLPPGEEQSLVSHLEEHPNLIILRSLTKFYRLPGLRLGYALGHPDILSQWQAWRDPWPVNVLAEAAAIACLEAEEFRQQVWQWLPPARTALQKDLASLPGLLPLASQANFLLVKTDIPAPELQQELLIKCQILIRDCLSFPELGQDFFRVAVRTMADNQKLTQALATVIGTARS
ncbi:threonine-phosphate decarboxylase [Synechocystis sp. LEGE 06083]|uniref:threonine-phosphate decarboxylase CobD n=1 Tax=Synechocystis sp. LEGE 06083 TaxID=915336 RepID=UPI00187EFF41|nr:threonine-phosphate decarboxylase CobD [Synechocystis sp. LEGE 06083]MBE9193746.1 threonine-phosphate decarboxylase [Synechocystis sp. LEGE 06083]